MTYPVDSHRSGNARMKIHQARHAAVRVHAAGTSGLLLDAATSTGFDDSVQERIWALASALAAPSAPHGVREVVPGVNNLLLVFDPLVLHPSDARRHLLSAWEAARPARNAGREVEIPVVYGGAHGEDLKDVAAATGLSVDEFVKRHSEAMYSVSCIGAMPGFAYLSGLPPKLSRPRRDIPRTRIAKGSVILGGSQAGIMPFDAPSGWHLLGHTAVELFAPTRAKPCLLSPGDRVRFCVLGVSP